MFMHVLRLIRASEMLFKIDHLLYIGSEEKPIQEKTGPVWAFSFSEKPLQALCRGFYPWPI
jgi:hypothetical protein